MPPKKRFEIKFLKSALDFINSLDIKVRSKIQFNITKSLIICTHGFIKKDQKTPLKEIEKAESLMKLYYQQTKH